MTNIFDYLKKYGDSSFTSNEFNELDAAILSLLSYIDYNNIIPPKKESITLQNALNYFLTYYDLKSFKKKGFQRKELLNLCKIIKDKERFKDIRLSNYVYKIGFDEQFSAITMRLPNKTVVVSFEGTDHNLSGWEEDFAFAYKFPVSCDTNAINYINKTISFFDKDIIVLGHSKGGHLSMVASMYASLPIRLRIKKIYNFDGPGLRKKEITSSKYKKISKKLEHIVPNHSIVGLLLRHSENIRVIKSERKDLYAHSIFNWEVEDKHFKNTTLSKLSSNLDKSIILWLDKHDDKTREIIVKNIFSYLRKNGITDITNLVKIKTLIALIKNSKELDKETKEVLANFVKFNFEYHMNTKRKKQNNPQI